MSQTVPSLSHIVVVIGENTAAASVFGNANAPYINAVAAQGAAFTNSYAITHPSQPNYLQLYSGSNQGITNDNLILTKFTTPNLGAELIQAFKSYTTYSDGLPSVGYDGATSGNYVRKHNPAANWMGTGTNQIPTTTNQPFTAFPTNFNNLPSVCFVVPDQCHDGHNVCPPLNNSVKQYDSWVQTNLDAYKQWCINNNSLLIITYDEDDNSASNKIATVFYGAHVAVGSYAQTINHYNVLRTIEDANLLASHAGAAATSTPIDFSWIGVLPVSLVNFSGIKANGGNLLRWKTVSETNFSGFQIERREDGNSFHMIGNKASAGPSDYSFFDPSPVSGNNFYRLTLIDRDGNISISNTITVYGNSSSGVTILPNPVSDIFHIKSEAFFVMVQLLATNGSLLKSWNNVTRNSIIDIHDVNQGIYLLRLCSTNGCSTVKLVKK
ncbi:MAG: alkaline phosphatase family protein [Ferruginibacter sp.]